MIEQPKGKEATPDEVDILGINHTELQINQSVISRLDSQIKKFEQFDDYLILDVLKFIKTGIAGEES